MLKKKLNQANHQKSFQSIEPQFTKQKCFRFQNFQYDKQLPSLKTQTHRQMQQLQNDISKIYSKKKDNYFSSDIAAIDRYKETRKWAIQRGKQTKLDFSEEELQIIKRYFNQLDSDQSGNIGIEELNNPFISLGVVENVQQVEQILSEVDKSGNGQIEFLEFLRFIKKTKNSDDKNFFKNTIKEIQFEHNKQLSFQTLVTQRRRQKFLEKMNNYNNKDQELCITINKCKKVSVRRVNFDFYNILMQNLNQTELKFILPKNVCQMLKQPMKLEDLKQSQLIHRENKKIEKVAILVSQKIELDPMIKRFNPELNDEITSQMIGLGRVFTQKLNNIELFFVKSLKSKDFDCENTGYSFVAALSALIVSVIDPDLLINFSICGSTNKAECNIGDFILTKNCFHMDRLRTKDQNAFEWGLWGGISIDSTQIQKEFNLKCEDFSSMIGISMNSFQEQILEQLQINYVDMECACLAEILNQTNTNFLGIKTIGFKINNQNLAEQESQFQNFLKRWYHQDIDILIKILQFIDGKTNSQL